MALQLLLQLGREPRAVPLGLSLLFTYLAHAALWAAAAALCLRRKSLSSATRHVFWKTALLGPLVSCAFAAALLASFESTPYVRELSMRTLVAAPSVQGAQGRAGVAVDAQASRPGTPAGMGQMLLVAFGATAALGFLRFAHAAWLLWRRLRARTQVQDARLLQRLDHMRVRYGLARVALSESSAVDAPLVVGASEICIPRAKLLALGDAELDSVFAHELAHLERRDWLWFPVIGCVQSVLWLQPINHWVAARFRETAELACDDRAVELTRDPLGLARALVYVAAGASFSERASVAPTMARSGSALLSRVQRLTVATRTDFQAQTRGRRWTIASLSVIGIAAASLSVQATVAAFEPAAIAHRPPSPVAAAGLSEQLTELVRRDEQLQTQLDEALQLAQPSAAGPSVRSIELQQELRHVREAEAWTEQRLMGQVFP